MKKINLIISCLVLFLSMTVSAQVDRSMDPNNNRNSDSQNDEERQKVFEKEKAKYIEKTVSKLKTDLELDALQEIAVKQIIVESARIEGIIIKKKDESDASKVKAIEALSVTTDTKITALLNPVQREKFIALKSSLKKKQ